MSDALQFGNQQRHENEDVLLDSVLDEKTTDELTSLESGSHPLDPFQHEDALDYDEPAAVASKVSGTDDLDESIGHEEEDESDDDAASSRSFKPERPRDGAIRLGAPSGRPIPDSLDDVKLPEMMQGARPPFRGRGRGWHFRGRGGRARMLINPSYRGSTPIDMNIGRLPWDVNGTGTANALVHIGAVKIRPIRPMGFDGRPMAAQAMRPMGPGHGVMPLPPVNVMGLAYTGRPIVRAGAPMQPQLIPRPPGWPAIPGLPSQVLPYPSAVPFTMRVAGPRPMPPRPQQNVAAGPVLSSSGDWQAACEAFLNKTSSESRTGKTDSHEYSDYDSDYSDSDQDKRSRSRTPLSPPVPVKRTARRRSATPPPPVSRRLGGRLGTGARARSRSPFNRERRRRRTPDRQTSWRDNRDRHDARRATDTRDRYSDRRTDTHRHTTRRESAGEEEARMRRAADSLGLQPDEYVAQIKQQQQLRQTKLKEKELRRQQMKQDRAEQERRAGGTDTRPSTEHKHSHRDRDREPDKDKHLDRAQPVAHVPIPERTVHQPVKRTSVRDRLSDKPPLSTTGTASVKQEAPDTGTNEPELKKTKSKAAVVTNMSPTMSLEQVKDLAETIGKVKYCVRRSDNKLVIVFEREECADLFQAKYNKYIVDGYQLAVRITSATVTLGTEQKH